MKHNCGVHHQIPTTPSPLPPHTYVVATWVSNRVVLLPELSITIYQIYVRLARSFMPISWFVLEFVSHI